ncbi:hypothetical protein CPC08DRAFT_706868 [Agrocybe pediades]|nr:hypothetical protein CPC08DRAFT_706868 [Agrocybe pediades]
MPNVFVVPPEEDETPPWCFFDAENPSFYGEPEYQDFHQDDVFAFNIDTPMFSRNMPTASVGISRGNAGTTSIVDALGHDKDDDEMDTDSEYEDDMEYEQSQHNNRQRIHCDTPTDEDPGNDSDVIEVVRVNRRNVCPDEQDAEARSVRTLAVKRSVTLKSRASKAFMSLRGRSKRLPPQSAHVQDGFRPVEDTQVQGVQPDSLPRSKSPSLSRRTSKVFSQFFAAPSLKSKRSSASFNDQPPPTMPPLPDSPISSPTSPQSEAFTCMPPSHRSSFSRNIAQDDRRLGATSPTFTMNSAKSQTSMFSISKLQKLFSFSNSGSDQGAPAQSSSRSSESNRSSSTTIRSTVPYTPPSAMSSESNVSSPQTPLSAGEPTSEPLVVNFESSKLPSFDNFDSIFNSNSDGINLGLGLSLESATEPEPMPRRKSFGSSSVISSLIRSGTSKGKKIEEPSKEKDDCDELELRLDSFHFDELSFDMDRFLSK